MKKPALPSISPSIMLLAALVIIFTILVAVEWYARFVRYHFEMQLIHLPKRAETLMAQTSSGFTTYLIPESRGGDLTAMIGLPRAAFPFEEVRPAGSRTVDPQGYVNLPAALDERPEAVVIGDSFMAVGRMEDMFATQLANVSGKYIYNRALMGHGPFISVERFLGDVRFHEKPPLFLIWGFAERELQGAFFKRLDFATDFYLHPEYYTVATNQSADDLPVPFIIHWKSFHPTALQKTLPASSILTQTSQWLWNRLRYVAFGRLNPDLIPVNVGDDGEPMLLYRQHIESIRMPEDERNIPQIVRAIGKLDVVCRQRGTRLIVVMIPEKEQVYREWIPASLVSPDQPMPPSSLYAVERALRDQSILAVNVLPVFDMAVKDGKRLYWRDDTHWNPEGIALAAVQVFKLMSSGGERL